jgi:CII-binding regulator of phage lambda lysogenization HflD
MMEHEHIISSHHKEMQELRNGLSLAMERFESLSKKNEQELKEFKEYSLKHICLIKDRMIANDNIIADQKKTIESLHKQLNEFHEVYASKIVVQKFKDNFQLEIKANTISHLNAFQEFQRELKNLINSLQNELIKLRCDTSLMNGELDNKIEKALSISRMDRSDVLKEIRTYEKTIFIIEKKIENIYTLIERLNKRGEVCHKPE